MSWNWEYEKLGTAKTKPPRMQLLTPSSSFVFELEFLLQISDLRTFLEYHFMHFTSFFATLFFFFLLLPPPSRRCFPLMTLHNAGSRQWL
jgi:hypothetical protein